MNIPVSTFPLTLPVPLTSLEGMCHLLLEWALTSLHTSPLFPNTPSEEAGETPAGMEAALILMAELSGQLLLT